MKVLVVGGGTGGHVIPALATAAQLKSRGAQILFVGSHQARDRELAEQAGYDFVGISAGKLRRYLSFRNLIDIWQVVAGYFQSRRVLRRFQPDVVFAKGGFVSVPVIRAAHRLQIPVVLHESDAVPGLANKVGVRHAAKIAVSYPVEQITGLPAEKMVYVGNPIPESLHKGKAERAVRRFRLNASLPLVLVLGGSQGSVAINRLVEKVLGNLLDETQIAHQVGDRSAREITHIQADLTTEQQRRYHPKAYFDDQAELPDLYAAADLVVARAGAGVLAGIAAVGKPSILIPLPSAAGDHQRRNAAVLQEAGAAVVLDESTLIAEELARQIKLLLGNPQRRAEMGRAARTLATPDAARKLADLIWEVGSGG